MNARHDDLVMGGADRMLTAVGPVHALERGMLRQFWGTASIVAAHASDGAAHAALEDCGVSLQLHEHANNWHFRLSFAPTF